MTHLKKSLALLLALIMMFSSMSVAANAAGSTGTETTEDDITFTVKFFREKNGEWIETTKAAPGDKVKARVYVETGFYANTSDSCIVFDNQYFTPFKYNIAGAEEGIQALVPNELAANKSYGDVNYAMTGTYTWRGDDSTWVKNMDFILDNIENDQNYFDTRDIITHTIAFPALAKNIKLTSSDWICEFNFKVNKNPLTNTVGSKGETEVPPYYVSSERTVTHPKFGEVNAELFINFPMGEEGGDLYSEQVSMKDWVPDFDTVPGTLTTTSEIIFDLGLGLIDEDGSYSEDNIYTIEKGIIGKEADLESVANPTHPEGKAFMYWSTKNPAEGATPEKVSTVSYDYDAVTLYAVWGEVPDVSYTLNEYYMKADGTYPDTVQGTQKDATPNSKVSAPASTDPLFTLDETMSDFDVVVNADGSSVVNAYYERNKYNLVYHYEDMAGAQTDSYKVRFGADLPGFRTTRLEDGTIVEGEPTKTGYTFIGWTTVEGGTEAETRPSVMPSEDLHLYPVYAPGETYDFVYIFNAGEGTFSNGENVMRYEYKLLDPVETPETPTLPGQRFVDWDDEIPEKAAEDKTFNAIYEPELYTVTFKADTDEDGEYETTVLTLEEEFEYEDKLAAKYAPENYPADAWKLEDGTAVEISDAETAYTVTSDVVLYTVGKDEYPARFYWSEKDMENGAEPYEVIYIKFDTSITKPADPQKPGYDFIIWEPDVESGLIMDSTDGKNFFALFEAKNITVTYDPDGGKCDVPSTNVKYDENGTITLPEATRDGYEFKGWITPEEENVGTAGDSYKIPTDDITLKADWDAEEHTITFVDDDGKELGKITADTDEEIETPKDLNPPVKKGHEFTGWTAAGVTGTVNVPPTMPADDMVLTATWNKLSYALNADANGGVFDNEKDKLSVEIPFGDPLNVEQPDFAGHKFLGWAYADDESNTIITLPKEMPDEALNIKAVWDTNKHDVYYDALGGIFTKEEGAPGFLVYKDIEYGKKIPVPDNNPEKKDSTFIRWSPEAPEAMPDNDLRFVAVWEENKPSEATYEIYAVTYNPANPTEKMEVLVAKGSGNEGETVEILKDGENKTADHAHTYAELVDALKSNSNEPNYNIRPEVTTLGEGTNKILVEFQLIEFVVTFNANDGVIYDENDKAQKEVVVKGYYGQPVNIPGDDALYLEGHDFTGWDENPEDTFTKNATYNATWAAGLFDAYFYIVDENGNETLYKTESFEFGDPIEAPEYKIPDGYKFSGWDIEGKTMGADEESFTATLTPIDYKLTYEISGLPADKDVSAPSEETGLHVGQDVDVKAAPVVEGYTFNGWYDDNDEKYFDDGTDTLNMPAKDVTLRGTYTAIDYTITYVTDGAGDIPADTYACDEVVNKLPEVSKDGFSFLGWYEGETKVEAGFKMPARDITLTAKWSEDTVESTTITLDAAGGTFSNGEPEYTITGAEGSPVTMPENPKWTGYEFIGWVDENGDAVSVPDVIPDEDTTLKADWAELYDVTYYDEDGETVIKAFVDAGKEGADIPTIDDPVKDGYEFVGWDGMPGDGKIPAGDLKITAIWKSIGVPEHKVEYFYGDPGVLHETLYFKEGAPIVHPEGPSIEGLTFTGWADENGNAIEVMGKEDIKAYAQYEFNTYKVTYIVDGEVYEEYDVLYQEEVPVPEDPADSETRSFAGWNPTYEAIMPAHDLTYTATWVTNTPEPGEYTATFLRHDGETHAKYVLEEGDAIPVPVAPQRFGYVFVGWEPEVPDEMPAVDMVFEPKYEIDKTFVTIVVGGTVVAGGVIAGSIIGANIAAITGISIVGGIIVIAGVAELVKRTHTVTYLVDGEVYKSYKVVEGTKIPVPADPAKDGFTFEGWNPEVPEKMGKEDLVFEATWAEVGAADDSTGDSSDVDVEIPETGSVAGGLTAFAVISGAAAAAYVITRRKKED